MATYIKTLKEDNGDIVYPQTLADAVYTNNNTTIETELAKYVTAEDIAQSVASFGTVTGGMIADNTISSGKVILSSFIDLFYPVGSYYETSDTTFDPNVSWTGTWVEDSAGKVLVSKDTGTFATVGDTGGEETHQLIENELPKISGNWTIHGQESGTEFYVINGHATGTLKSNQYKTFGSSATAGANSYSDPGFAFGNNGSHNNLQPYIVVKRWHRTA